MRLKTRTFLTAVLIACCFIAGGAARASAQGTPWDVANDAAEAALARGDHAEAERKHLEALKHAEKIGPKYPQTVATLTRLAALYEKQMKPAEAESAYRRAVESAEALAAAKDSHFASVAPEMHAASLERLADFLSTRKKFNEAEGTYKRALDVLARAAGADEKTPKTNDEWMGFLVKAAAGGTEARYAAVADKLAVLYLTHDRFAEAEPLFKLSVAAQERVGGEKPNPNLGVTLENLGVLYARQGRFEQAEPHFRRALQVYERSLGPEHAQMAPALDAYSLLLAKLGREGEAAAARERARAIRAKVR
ncbi:MAG TPA: tetratricopeptide repeat protein [Pyrinomonadaceae bacterium]|nr:tetratricopeptide repeat protein [Pyrinomonadaceae bacterium]